MKKKKIIFWILVSPIILVLLVILVSVIPTLVLSVFSSQPISIECGFYSYSYDSGLLKVNFKENVTYQEAKDIIKFYGLSLNKEYIATDFKKSHGVLVDIPKGEEKKWKQKLAADNKIAYVVTEPIVSELPLSFFQKITRSFRCAFFNFLFHFIK